MSDLDKAKDFLLSYIREMNKWELRSAERRRVRALGEMSFEEYVRLVRGDYCLIFEKYCAQSRKGLVARMEDLNYGMPPDYDPDLEEIAECRELSDGGIEIRTLKNDSLKQQFVYHVGIENGELRLFGKQFVGVEGGLVKAIL